MADLTSDLPHKIEGAFYSYLSTLGLARINYFGKGHSNEDIVLPSVISICDIVGDEVVKDTGIKSCKVIVEVRSSGEDVTSHILLSGTINDLLQMDNIETTLTASGDNFHCYDVSFVSMKTTQEEQNLLTQIELEAVCCAATVT